MEIRADFLEMATRFGGALLDGIVARDNLHLSPHTVRPGAATRIRQGIRRLEAYLKRLILAIALRMEHALPADIERPVCLRPRADRVKPAGFSVFSSQFDENRTLGFTWRWETPKPYIIPGAPVCTRDLLARLAWLRALLDAPQARAKRLAWHLARRRHGWLRAPDAHIRIATRFGSEIGAIYDALAQLLGAASLQRPPPRGPAPRPPPRIRVL